MKTSQNGASARSLALGGMLAALVFVATYFFKIPVSVTQGYIHLGDGFILLGATLLGHTAIVAAAVGSMLADLLGGYTLYVVPTFVIKGCVATVAVWGLVRQPPVWLRVMVFLAAEAIMVLGYFLVEWLVLGYGLAAALGALLPNMVQGLSGVVVAVVFMPLNDRLKRLLHEK